MDVLGQSLCAVDSYYGDIFFEGSGKNSYGCANILWREISL